MALIALIAHDGKKERMAEFCRENAAYLKGHDIVATGTTAGVVRVAVPSLNVRPVLSGPRGGDVQIAAEVLEGGVMAVLFFVEPMESHPHDPDIRTLERICTLQDVPFALNPATATLVLRGMTTPGPT